MADVFGNPYLPSFVRSQPKAADPMPFQQPALPVKTCQIQSVAGFQGARQHASKLTNGSSELVADIDQNLSRIYAVVIDQNGQQFIQGFDLIPVEEPKPVTIDDLNDKMNKVLERLNQLEERKMTEFESDNILTGSGKPDRNSGQYDAEHSAGVKGSDVSASANVIK